MELEQNWSILDLVSSLIGAIAALFQVIIAPFGMAEAPRNINTLAVTLRTDAAYLDQVMPVLRQRVLANGMTIERLERMSVDRISLVVVSSLDLAELTPILTTPGRVEIARVLEPETSADLATPGRMLAQHDGQMIKVEQVASMPLVRFATVEAVIDQSLGAPMLNFQMDAASSTTFATLTTTMTGKRFAIILDGAVLSAPAIMSPILDGRGQITGALDMKTAQKLAEQLAMPPLPAPVAVEDIEAAGGP
jgi:preprotein translocase subunit SecD